ncbi:hypothetical protein K3M67_03245 [Sphingobium sp. V4]|uniref:hypothetical protein n=1 Tax=Sphingobium sp. V4 TaxID=3038927 RepID=UPI002557CC38|nr:hypothetical protein [Sphingobium sp. V4]WIW89010.1 hypothetical protein K3M67_03245 [Sphingobium sp. V4]
MQRRISRKTVRLLYYPTAFAAGLLGGWVLAFVGGLNPAIVPVISAGIGLLVAFGVPIWQNYYINTPKLAIEISSIKRVLSDSTTIAIHDDAELKVLYGEKRRNYSYFGEPELFGRTGKNSGETIDNLQNLLELAKQRLRDLPAQIEDRKRSVEQLRAVNPTALTRYQVDSWNAPLSPEVEFDPSNLETVASDLIKAYEKRLETAEKSYADLQTNLPIAERRIEIVQQELIRKNSLFTVSASLINSGRTNTAIKVPALLRVLIGEGNYIDIKLSLKDFENKSEIAASGTRIVVFESLEISSLPEEDRALINTYWGQSVRAWLLVEDIHGGIAKSGYIAFAEGLYQKIIYDRLARAAST